MADVAYCRSVTTVTLLVYDCVGSALFTLFLLSLSAIMIRHYDARFGILTLLGAVMACSSEWLDSVDRLILQGEQSMLLPRGYQVLDGLQYTMAHCGIPTFTLGIILSISVHNAYLAAAEGHLLSGKKHVKKRKAGKGCGMVPEWIQKMLLINDQLKQSHAYGDSNPAWWKQTLPPQSFIVWYVIVPSILYMAIMLFGMGYVLFDQISIHLLHGGSLNAETLEETLTNLRRAEVFLYALVDVVCGTIVLLIIGGQLFALGWWRNRKPWKIFTLLSVAIFALALLLRLVSLSIDFAEHYTGNAVTLYETCEMGQYFKETTFTMCQLCNLATMGAFAILLRRNRCRTKEEKNRKLAPDGSTIKNQAMIEQELRWLEEVDS